MAALLTIPTRKERKQCQTTTDNTASAPPEDHWSIVKRRGRAGGEQPRESTPKALGQLNGQPGVIHGHAASGEAKLDHEGGSRGGGWGLQQPS